MTDPASAPPLNLTDGPPRCDACPPLEIRRPYDGDVIDVNGRPFYAIGWDGSQMVYREGVPPAPPPRPAARPGDDSIANWIS